MFIWIPDFSRMTKEVFQNATLLPNVSSDDFLNRTPWGGISAFAL
jgi:hypothetical protein